MARTSPQPICSTALAIGEQHNDGISGTALLFPDHTRRIGRPVTIDGLWGIAFGNGFQQQPPTTLFFAAGPNDENDGLYGRIDALPGGNDEDDNDDSGD